MDDRKKTLAAITVLVVVGIIGTVLVGNLVFGRKIISPVPDDGAIRIIFISPTQPAPASPSATPKK